MAFSEREQESELPERAQLQELRVRRASLLPGRPDAYGELQRRLLQRLNDELGPQLAAVPAGEGRQQLRERLDLLLAEENIILTRIEKRNLFEDLVADLLGFGPLERLLAQQDVKQIMVNGPQRIFIERQGALEKTDVTFEDQAHLLRIVQRIVATTGEQLRPDATMITAQLGDGWRVSAVLPPVAPNGPVLSIRRALPNQVSPQALCERGTISTAAMAFMQACVEARLNIVISGNRSAGKTTLLNALCTFIGASERVVTLETTAELRLPQENVVSLELPPQQLPASLTMHQLLETALRLRPDRLVVDELDESAVLALLQAMRSGYDGSMATCHAWSPRDLLTRLESMALTSERRLPVKANRALLTDALDLVVHAERLRDGSQRVTAISEVLTEGAGDVELQEIFRFERTGIEKGRVAGELRATGLQPAFTWKLREAGVTLPPAVFESKRK